MSPARLLAVVLAVLALLLPAAAAAHGMRTAYVQIDEGASGHVSVLVRSGASYGGVTVHLPSFCAPAPSGESGYLCARPLAGASVRVEGLGGVVSDAVVMVRTGERTRSALLRPDSPTFEIPSDDGTSVEVARFVRAGVVHVLSGADHLLFLLALVVAMRSARAVLLAETAFTVSHSLSFAATALGLLHVPSAVAEASIAASLVLLAAEVARGERLTARAGALMAFVFGAVHGLGFAGGLTELGVPRDAAGAALVSFAMGVELGQVAFLLACFAARAALARAVSARTIARAAAWAVGVAGAYWVFDRAAPLLRQAFSS